jgi:glycosyltransferase involved in cell wall biosynthesis
VIPVRDMEDTIGAQLAALARQDFSGSWEIIVADNGSRDATGRIAEQWRDRLPILLVDASGPADAGYARNMGVRAALGELLLFCDADDEVRPEWLRLLAGALGRNAVAVGRIDHAKFNSPRLARAADQPLVGCGFLPPGGACNLGIRRSVFDQLGGFPEGYLRMEDTALLFRAQLGGHELAFEESAVVDRRLKAVTPRQMFALHLRAGRSVVRMYKDFHGVGMPHSPLRDLVYDYLSIPARLAAGRRKQAAEVAGWRLGRLLGSLRAGTLYL